MEKVFIGTLVRERGWILPTFIEHIGNIKYPKRDIKLAFLVNDSTDNSFELINNFQVNNIDKYINVSLYTNNACMPKDEQKNGERDGTVRGSFLYARLAKLRNMMIKFFLASDCDYYLSVDSDILVQPNILNELIDLKSPMAAAIILNDNGRGKNGNIMNYSGTNCDFKHVDLLQNTNQIIECDLSGACILFSRQILTNSNFRYELHSLGEDAGLHLKTYRAGHKIKAKRGLAKHIMHDGMLDG